jgi:hypothetical protein
MLENKYEEIMLENTVFVANIKKNKLLSLRSPSTLC